SSTLPLSLSHRTATTQLYTLSLHDALPISPGERQTAKLQLFDNPSSQRRCFQIRTDPHCRCECLVTDKVDAEHRTQRHDVGNPRSEEHTSELQSRENLVCRLLLEKKKKNKE